MPLRRATCERTTPPPSRAIRRATDRFWRGYLLAVGASPQTSRGPRSFCARRRATTYMDTFWSWMADGWAGSRAKRNLPRSITMFRVKPKGEGILDLVSLGEVMLRLDPGEDRIHTTRNFRVW